MKKHIIYFVTDANRTVIQVEYCSNIAQRLIELQEVTLGFVCGRAKLCRIVYMEEFINLKDAQRRKLELSSFTHMMKERLIRRQNPNWKNITYISSYEHKKTVAYA